jgi:hypothetical protein
MNGHLTTLIIFELVVVILEQKELLLFLYDCREL